MFPAWTLWNFGVLTHLGKEGCIWFFFAFSLTPPSIVLYFPPTIPEFSQQSLCFCYCPLAFMRWGRILTLSLAGDPETEVSSPILQRLWLRGSDRGPLARLPPFCPACCSLGASGFSYSEMVIMFVNPASSDRILLLCFLCHWSMFGAQVLTQFTWPSSWEMGLCPSKGDLVGLNKREIGWRWFPLSNKWSGHCFLYFFIVLCSRDSATHSLCVALKAQSRWASCPCIQER